MQTYDVIVIGSGGGQKIARPAAAMGLRVALIDPGPVGGTCLNRGCIPSKMLIYPGEVADAVRGAQAFGITVPGGVGPIDFAGIVQRISSTVDAISADQRDALKKSPNIDFFPEPARFIANRILAVGDRHLTAPKIFIATGAYPALPELPGLAGTPYLTSTEALRNTTLPQRLLVIGASYIAAELGYAYRALGSQVDFFVRSRFFRGQDEDVVAEFERVFQRHHRIHRPAVPQSVTYRDGVFTLNVEQNGVRQDYAGDALLVATGVTPATEGLGLEHTDITRDKRGCIRVNDHLETAAPGVYALGDCVGNYFFRHTVNFEGEYLVRQVLQQASPRPIDYGPVPHAVFTEPQIAGVGMNEQAAIAAGRDILVGKASYADSTPGMSRLSDHGFVKVIVERTTDRILGAQIIGAEASNMIHLFIAAMKMKATLADLLDMIFIHPALPEVARDALRDAGRQRKA